MLTTNGEPFTRNHAPPAGRPSLCIFISRKGLHDTHRESSENHRGIRHKPNSDSNKPPHHSTMALDLEKLLGMRRIKPNILRLATRKEARKIAVGFVSNCDINKHSTCPGNIHLWQGQTQRNFLYWIEKDEGTAKCHSHTP